MFPKTAKRRLILRIGLFIIIVLLAYNAYLVFSNINWTDNLKEEITSFPPHFYKPEIIDFVTRPVIAEDSTYKTQLAYGKKMHNLMGLRIFVNRTQLIPTYDSIGGTTYTYTPKKPTSIGRHEYSAKAIFLNPHTERMDTIERTFSFAVQSPKPIIYLDKNNKLYKGIENTLSLTETRTMGSTIYFGVHGCGAKLKKTGAYFYNVHASDTGHIWFSYLNKFGNPQHKKNIFHYTVVELPNPVARIAGQQSGVVSSAEFNQYKGLTLKLESVETDSTCRLQSYKLIYTPNRKNAQVLKGSSLEFKGKILQTIQAAQPNDQYHFIDIMAVCPADTKARRISSLVFMVK